MKTLKYITIIIIVLILLSPIVIIKYNTNITARQIALYMILLLYFNGIWGILKAINRWFKNTAFKAFQNRVINQYNASLAKDKQEQYMESLTKLHSKISNVNSISNSVNNKVCIKGNPYKSQATIDYFEALGFVNSLNLTCNHPKSYYYGVNGRIFCDNRIPEGYIEIEL